MSDRRFAAIASMARALWVAARAVLGGSFAASAFDTSGFDSDAFDIG